MELDGKATATTPVGGAGGLELFSSDPIIFVNRHYSHLPSLPRKGWNKVEKS
jgi:hypothetical protein